jgi:protein O-GlcNAcase/histone acetyltransferase
MQPSATFVSGVIEGFYGRPWSAPQRLEMMDWIAGAGMNLYAYAPKDDVKLRARWREPYDAAELAALAHLTAAAGERGLAMMAAIAPCLDITHGDPAEIAALLRRLDQFTALGIRHIALLFDDIPSTLNPADAALFPSFAAAQCHVANAAWAHLQAQPGTRLYFCPTEYCGRMAAQNPGGDPGGDPGRSPYLRTLGEQLAPEIAVFWTGSEIISPTIDAEELQIVAWTLQRKPVIWENFHANDYDIRRVHAGPLAGRDPAIRAEISGYITNPNNEFEANFVPVATTGAFLRDVAYDPDAAAAAACSAWRPRFQLAYGSETLTEAEVALIADLFHQPFTPGPQARALLETARDLLSAAQPDIGAAAWQDGRRAIDAFHERVAALFDRLTEIANRDLFYTFQPYLWEAREELRTLAQYLDWLSSNPAPGATFPEADRLPNTYRRGFAAELSALLPRDRAGIIRHAG